MWMVQALCELVVTAAHVHVCVCYIYIYVCIYNTYYLYSIGTYICIVYTSLRLIYAIWLTHSDLYNMYNIYIFDLSWYVTGDAIYNIYYYYSVRSYTAPHPIPDTSETHAHSAYTRCSRIIFALCKVMYYCTI